MLRLLNTFHTWVYRTTRGRLGRRLLWVPCLLLITTGRKTGKRRETALVYAEDGDRYVVVPSNAGADRAPGWLHNLRSKPDVEVYVGRRHVTALARVVGRDEPDFARLWKLVNENNGGRYDNYQSKTKRQIQVVVLDPTAG